MKLLRWMISTVVMVPFGALGGWLLSILMRPSSWYAQTFACLLLVATAAAWVWTTWRINRYLHELGW